MKLPASTTPTKYLNCLNSNLRDPLIRSSQSQQTTYILNRDSWEVPATRTGRSLVLSRNCNEIVVAVKRRPKVTLDGVQFSLSVPEPRCSSSLLAEAVVAAAVGLRCKRSASGGGRIVTVGAGRDGGAIC